jgi:multiple antibiotic resistance protein
MSLLTLFFSLLAITNPIGNTAIFVSMTQGLKRQDLIKICLRTGISVFIILILSAFVGVSLLHVIGVKMSAFEFASGMILIKIGFSMFYGTLDKSSYNSDEHDRDMAGCAIVPLAIPFFAGPGAIAAVIHFTNSMSYSLMNVIGLVAVVLIMSMIITGCMLTTTVEYFQGIMRRKSVIGVVTRVFGLLVVAIGSEMLLEGLQAFLK